MQQRIVCAANKSLTSGEVILGVRHYDGFMCKIQRDKKHAGEIEQGFIDQYGTFLTRTEAWKVALAAGQILRRCGGDDKDSGTLYSENLY